MSEANIIPTIDPRAEALKYLDKHKLIRLFDILGAKLAYLKPENPNDFLILELTKVAGQLSRNQPVTLFNEEDIGVMFTVFDLTNRGYLTQIQYTTALMSIGVEGGTTKRPIGDAIDKNTFTKHLLAEVTKNAF